MNVEEKLKHVRLNTMQWIALGFFGVIFTGGVLLWLPICNQKPIEFIDALFTSVSAVCVTGLVTITPVTQFTLLGKVILLALIQVGGLGVIACTLWFFVLIKRKITVRERVIIQQTYNLDQLSGMVRFILRVVKGTFAVEGIGALLFCATFIPRYGVIRGIWYSVFHSISAFCNAGIDILDSDSFIPYVSNPTISLTTMFLIIAGGLGFTVWHDVRVNTIRTIKKRLPLKRLFTRLQLHSKIVIAMSAALIVLGTCGFFIFEFHNTETMGDLNLWQKAMASAFQSVTTRTAGFATVSQASLTPASKFLSCILMVIGGSPAGTAGGMKTTTMAMLLLTCFCVIRGKENTECFGRKISVQNIRTGIVIVMITFSVLLVGIMCITVFEPGKNFLDILMETSSAIGTVGLSASLTPTLTRNSQIVLMVMMYVGRIGPITMALVLGGRADGTSQLRDLPEKRIMVG